MTRYAVSVSIPESEGVVWVEADSEQEAKAKVQGALPTVDLLRVNGQVEATDVFDAAAHPWPETLSTEVYAATYTYPEHGPRMVRGGSSCPNGLYNTLKGVRMGTRHGQTIYRGRDEDDRPIYERLPAQLYRGTITWEEITPEA